MGFDPAAFCIPTRPNLRLNYRIIIKNHTSLLFTFILGGATPVGPKPPCWKGNKSHISVLQEPVRSGTTSLETLEEKILCPGSGEQLVIR